MLIVISGAGGVGKTTLGVCWLHRIRGSYRHGQLFADLRGFSGESPAAPSEALEHFLRALGAAPDDVPVEAEEQAALFRSLTDGRRLIIMLDNAASAAQVRPLLPAHGPAVVVVTTRQRLTGLVVDGAVFVPLGPLVEADAVRLLDRMLGSERTGAEPEEARALTLLCGRLPLALSMAAARLATRPWPIARVVAELTDERKRLSALSVEGDDISVHAVFDVSYLGLPADAAALYRLLSQHPGPDFNAAAAAAVMEAGQEAAGGLLDVLAGANLLEETANGRFRIHDLVRLHARSLAERIDPPQTHAAAFARLLDHYLGIAVAADLAIIPGRWHLGRHYDLPPRASFADAVAAIGWLELELPNLVAFVHSAHARALHRDTWELVEALWGLFTFRKHYRMWLDTHEIGLASARACGDSRAQARMLEALASGQLNVGDFASARRCSEEAVALERTTYHFLGEAAALECLGVAQLGLGDLEGAIGSFRGALSIHQSLERSRGIALMRLQLGEALLRAGRDNEALGHLAQALRFFDERNDRYNAARALSRLAELYISAGRYEEARTALRVALAAADEIGARHRQAGVHVLMARLAEQLGQREGERDHLEVALAIYTDLGAPEREAVRVRLAERGWPSSSPGET